MFAPYNNNFPIKLIPTNPEPPVTKTFFELKYRDINYYEKYLTSSRSKSILFSDDKNFVNQESKNSWSLIGGNEDEITQKIGDFQDLGVDEIIVASYDKSTYQSIGMEEMNHFSESIIKFFNG